MASICILITGHNPGEDVNDNLNDKNGDLHLITMARSSDCRHKGTVMASDIWLKSSCTRAGPSLGAFVPCAEPNTPSRTGEWGLMSICLAVIISPTSSWPDSHKHMHTNAAVSQCVLPVSQASNPLLICVPPQERMISLLSVNSFQPVHPLIQNRAICHAYHPSLLTHLVSFCLFLSLPQILASQTSSRQESLWPHGAAAHHTLPLKCLKDSSMKDHSWTSG